MLPVAKEKKEQFQSGRAPGKKWSREKYTIEEGFVASMRSVMSQRATLPNSPDSCFLWPVRRLTLAVVLIESPYKHMAEPLNVSLLARW